MVDQLEFLVRNLVNLLVGFRGSRPGGLLMSLALSAVSILVGLVAATALGHAQHSARWWMRLPTMAVVRTVRGVPLLVLLVLIHQLLKTSSLVSAFVTLSIYAAAYLADVVHAGFAAVPRQLIEDARLLGARPGQLARTVTIPYAFRTMLPALTSQAITIFKDSSVVVILGVADLTTTARIVLGSSTQNTPYWVGTYLMVGLLYFVTALGLSRVAARFERHMPHRREGVRQNNHSQMASR